MQEPVADFEPGAIKAGAPEAMYFYGGKIHPHYGHFLLSTFSRFWPLIKYGKPKCKILMHEETEPAHWFSFPHVAYCFAKLGLAPADFVKFDYPVRIERLVVAHPSFEEEHFAHAAFARLGNAIGRLALRDIEIQDNPRPVYLSKSRLKSGVWRFVNEAELAANLSRHGVDVVFPEQLSLDAQIGLFSERRVLIGSMASFFHTSIFSSTRPILIGINHQRSALSNYTLSDAVNGIDGRYFYPHDGVRYAEPGSGFSMNCHIENPVGVAEDIMRCLDGIRVTAN